MTRARKLLFLTYPARKIFRKKDLTVTPCRFIREIPEKYLNTDLMVEHEAKKQEFGDEFSLMKCAGNSRKRPLLPLVE